MHWTPIDIEPGRPFILSNNELAFICPGCGQEKAVEVYRAPRKKPGTPTWELIGDESNPTLHPSLDCPCGFHSFLENGISREA